MAATQQQRPPARTTQAAAPDAGKQLIEDILAEETVRIASRYKPVMSMDETLQRREFLREYISRYFVEGTHFVRLPAAEGKPENKPFLSKAGAQALCALFGYVPAYETEVQIEDWTGEGYSGEPLFYYRYKCVLAKDGARVGEGVGSCNSWEAKYRYRIAAPECPECGVAAIIKGKEEYGGGFVCFKKKGGCNAKFAENDPRILEQPKGRVPNPDFPDVVNVCQKQGEKRAYVEATLSATGATEFFSQDEENIEALGDGTPRQARPPAASPKPVGNGKPNGRPVPEELRVWFAKLTTENLASAFQFLDRELTRVGGPDLGPAAYDKILAEWEAKLGGKGWTVEAGKSALLDMWDAVEAFTVPPAEVPDAHE